MEGTQEAVVGTDDFVIDNRLSSSDPFWVPYNNRVIHVVYLFQSWGNLCLLYTSPSPRDATLSRMPSSA